MRRATMTLLSACVALWGCAGQVYENGSEAASTNSMTRMQPVPVSARAGLGAMPSVSIGSETAPLTLNTRNQLMREPDPGLDLPDPGTDQPRPAANGSHRPEGDDGKRRECHAEVTPSGESIVVCLGYVSGT